MKRKKFIQTMSVGIAALYATGLEACSKSKNIEPDIAGPVLSGNNPPGSPILSDSAIVDGYTDKLSYNTGESVKIYINGEQIQDAKFGIYSPNGILKEKITSNLGKQVPGPDSYMNGFQYTLTCSFQIPENFPSGIYFIAKKIVFIVKNKARNGDAVVVLASNTDNAYNQNGGMSSYTTPFSPILSFQRPYSLSGWSAPFWSWLENLAYNIDYIVDQDLDEYSNFSYSKVLILPGHNEYWTKVARTNFDKFIDEGKNALILSGNTMWWQIRYSEDKTQMICYKDFYKDPISDNKLKTINWYEKVLKYPIEKSIGLNFDLGGYGDGGHGWSGYKIVNEKSPLLVGTNLKNGDVLKCLTQEYDGTFLKFENGNPYPVIDNKMNFHKIELVGFDNGFRLVKTVGTFIAVKKTLTSGTMVNMASTNWCSKRGIEGEDEAKIKKITLNAINLLLSGGNVFTG